MESFQEEEEKQLETMKKLNQLRSQAKSSINQYQNEIEQLQQKKNYLLQFMKLYQNDTTQKKLAIDSFFESTKDVYTNMIEYIKDIKRWVYKVDFDMDKKIQELNKMDNDNQAYPLTWPIYPIEEIQTYFWDEAFQKQYGFPHVGIQIKAEQGTPIYAARNGIVYFVADSDAIAINRMIIVHTDGYVSSYQYLNETLVKPWDIVRRGELIWYSWWEPGTRWAGFVSQGANLSFSIFKDAIARDPFEILDTSIVRNKDVLPEWYQIKYLRDKYARTIDITELEVMTGSTHIQRQIQFLSRYGVGTYRNIVFRESVAKDTNIDVDMVICVAFAESTLWRHLSTSNNIGNVGNNDRWDRVGFSSAYAGARAIPLTLNNRALGSYHTINQLSRYGNKDGMIYASSPINRQTNVLKCLSQIKGYYIPEDFPFRTWPNPNLQNSEPETVEFGERVRRY
jgi:murein DD-endopeptidase MepM/ murein hydrolase activator NlpD